MEDVVKRAWKQKGFQHVLVLCLENLNASNLQGKQLSFRTPVRALPAILQLPVNAF